MAEEKVIVAKPATAEAKPVAPASRPSAGGRPTGAPHGDRPRGDHKGGPRRDRAEKEFEERVVSINRVSKTVKGGRHMRFAAIVVVGDGKGQYGFGTGKAGEVPDAIKKALEAAKKKMFRISLEKGDTISHEIVGKFGACNVFLKPAPAGTGIVAGGPVRAILELAGVKNVYSKVYGSRAPINIIRATNNGIENLHTYSQVKLLRGK